jgi:hypothetical protein
VFFRPYDHAQRTGRLWVSGIDGSDPVPVTPDGVQASFAGMPDGDTLYWVEQIGPEEAVLHRQTLSTGLAEDILHLAVFQRPYAEVSPDGRRVVYIDGDSLSLLDRTSAQTRRLLEGHAEACEGGQDIPRCFVYRTAQWSPDGSLLVVEKGFWEGSTMVIVDPNTPEEIPIGDEFFIGPYFAAWSPDSRTVCLLGKYASPSAFYVARAPEWAVSAYLQNELEPTPGPNTGETETASGCAWASADRLAVSTTSGYDGRSRVGTLELASGILTQFELVVNDQPGSRELVGAPGQRLAVTQALVADGGSGQPSAIHQVDTQTGALAPILQPRDWVVAVVDIGG